jgi:zinc protease
MTNRTISPPTYLTDRINIPNPKPITLTNGARLVVVNEGDVDVCRIDAIFNAGSRFQKQKLVASGTMSLMPEGTTMYSSQQVSEYFDYWGSFINFSADKDFARATAYSLTKHLTQTLEMIDEILKKPTFPKTEIDVWSRRGKQSLTVEMDKTSTLARMEFFKSLFGKNHPYGIFALPTDYDSINSSSLSDYHKNYFGSEGNTIFLSGRLSDEHISLVSKYFGETQWGNVQVKSDIILETPSANKQQLFVSKKGALQSAIRVGKVLFNRQHPEYPELSLVVTILGGYFGSRLMKNIREDKGYTYGIGAYLLSFRDSGALIIATEVGSEYTKPTLVEIKKEIGRLIAEPISEEELSRVKNFLMGEALRSFNGPFAIADSILSLHQFNDLDNSFYDRVMHSIKTITPERIMELAAKWIHPDSLTECVSGAENPF